MQWNLSTTDPLIGMIQNWVIALILVNIVPSWDIEGREQRGTIFTNISVITLLQSNFDGSNIFGTIENCSRHGWFEPLRVNYGAVRKQMGIV